jgi:hypothetical protein
LSDDESGKASQNHKERGDSSMFEKAQNIILLTDYGWRVVGVLALVAGVITGYVMGVL